MEKNKKLTAKERWIWFCSVFCVATLGGIAWGVADSMPVTEAWICFGVAFVIASVGGFLWCSADYASRFLAGVVAVIMGLFFGTIAVLSMAGIKMLLG